MKITNYTEIFSNNFSKRFFEITQKYSHSKSNLSKALYYTIKVGGKRLRPLLLMEISKILDVKTSYALNTASSVELIHCYSLVHDDLPAMDDDDLRRGKPTCHKQFDEATAILVGDALQSLAYEILSEKQTHPSFEIRCKLINLLTKCSGLNGMVDGQMLDIEAEKKKLSHNEVTELQRLKTGKLFNFSCLAPCILADSEKKYYKIFNKFSYNIGLAFQIRDDILDIEGEEDKTGKKTKKDKEMGKETFIDLMGIEGSKNYAKKLISECQDLVFCFGKKSEILKQICSLIINRVS
tara:strand:- start:45 stop:929 length:885 start_codon:yes stop_codon:yes gene_type:complete